MWVNVGVEVVVVRRLCWGAVAPGVSVFVAGPALQCRVCGAAACRVLPSLGARRRAPNPRPRGWWRSLSGSLWEEVGAGFWGVHGLFVGRFVRRMGEGVSPDKYCPAWIGANRPVACQSIAHSFGDADHNCTSVRLCVRAREDVQGRSSTTSETHSHGA